jgi:CRP/FNR family cyclic AMP-dependent transcriptional regulator
VRKVLFILSELDDGDLAWLIEHGRKRSVPTGTTLIEEGRQIELLYILLDGQLSVRLRKLGEREVARLQSGEILGELSFLDSRPSSASVISISPATVLCVSRELLTSKLSADAPFAARFYRALGVFLASRLRRSLQQLGYGDAEADQSGLTGNEEELDPALLEQMGLAGARFNWMLRQLRDAPESE